MRATVAGAAERLRRGVGSAATSGPAVRRSTDPTGLGIWRRHPADAARCLVSLVGLVAVLGLTYAKPATVTGISRDLADLMGWLPSTVREAALGVAQLAAIAGPIVLLIVLIVTAQYRLASLVVGAAAVAALATTAMQRWLDDTAPAELINRLATESWVTGAAFPSPAYLAGFAAAVTVLVPGLGRVGHRVAWWMLGLFAMVRIATAVAIPLHVGATVLLGITVGSALLVAFGGPGTRNRPADVAAAAAAAGLDLREVVETAQAAATEGSAGPSGAWRPGHLRDGSPVAVRVIDRDERDADALYRLWSRLERRGLGGERPAWSPRRLAEHEALVTMLAGAAGVRVPSVVAVGALDDHLAALVVRDEMRPAIPVVPVVSADAVAQPASIGLSDELLQDLWAQVAALHQARIAHRSLRLASVGVRDGKPVLADFAGAELSAPDDLLAADVAELLVSLGRHVGAERAVASAEALGPDRLGAALPFIQPLALSMPTRRQLKADGRARRNELFAALRAHVQDAAAVEAVELAPLQRISVARAVGLFGAVVLAYVVLAFVSNRHAIAGALGDADLTRLPVIAVFTAVTYVAGALSLSGAVSVDLPLSQSSEVMLAQSFLNRFTPANAGGMALRARYLQRHGVDLAMAATSIGLTSAASGLAHLLFLVVFLTWSGQSGGIGFQLPDASGLAVVIAVLMVAGGLLWLTPLRAKLLDSRLFASVERTARELRALATQPGKLVRLLGGAVLGKLVVLLAFVQSARAFGISTGFADLGALYLTANTVASAAPTPGGVGAVEAALVAVLTGADIDGATALSTVLVFRLATFWLPVPPAWLALRHLRASDAV